MLRSFLKSKLNRNFIVLFLAAAVTSLSVGFPASEMCQVAKADTYLVDDIGDGTDNCGFWCRVGKIALKILKLLVLPIQLIVDFFNENCEPPNPETCERGPDGRCLDEFT